MNYIVLDLEWNQPLPGAAAITSPFFFDSEIIEIGAVKMDDRFQPVAEYKTLIKPAFYPIMNGGVVRLTKIRPQELSDAPAFPAAYEAFRTWCGEDCGFCSWGPDDVPVLLDNLLMHGLPIDSVPVSFDLQRIFGREIMRDERQCSLEKAMELLGQTPDRAHDALNDARNTVRACGYMDLERCMGEYALFYPDYAHDRLGGLFAGRDFGDLTQALQDGELGAVSCPYCAQRVALGDWARQGSSTVLGYGRCQQGDEFCAQLRHTKRRDGTLHVSRRVWEMNDDLWDTYQAAWEQAKPL